MAYRFLSGPLFRWLPAEFMRKKLFSRLPDEDTPGYRMQYGDDIPLRVTTVDTSYDPLSQVGNQDKAMSTDEGTQATRQYRLAAPLLRYWLHIATLCATAAVVQLSFRNSWTADDGAWGDNNDRNPWTMGLEQKEYINILQFPAKIHELFIVASLSTIIFDLFKKQMKNRGSIPFGFLAGGYQVGKPEYITSKAYTAPFWNSLRGRDWGLTGLGLVLGVAVLYVNVVGPATAALIIPSLEWYKMPQPFTDQSIKAYHNGSMIWPKAMNKKPVLPNSMCNTIEFNLDCLHGGAWDIYQWTTGHANQNILPNVTMKNRLSQYTRDVASVQGKNKPSVQIGITVHAAIAELLGLFWNYVHSNHGIGPVHHTRRPKLRLEPNNTSIFSPLVRTECQTYNYYDWIKNGTKREWDTTKANPEFPKALQNDPAASFRVPDNGDDWKFADSESGVGFTWIQTRDLGNRSDALKLETMGGSIGAAWFTPDSEELENGDYKIQEDGEYVNKTGGKFTIQKQWLTICLADARWIPTVVSFDGNGTGNIDHNFRDGKILAQLELNSTFSKDHDVSPSIPISTKWADELNAKAPISLDKDDAQWEGGLIPAYILPFITTRNDTDVQDRTTGELVPYREYLKFNPAQYRDDLKGYKRNLERTLSITLNLLLTDGLARSANHFLNLSLILTSEGGQHEENSYKIVSLEEQKGKPNDDRRVTQEEMNDMLNNGAKSLVFFEFSVYRYGWGYSTDSKTVQFALSVVLLHAALALVYLALQLFPSYYQESDGAWSRLEELVALAWVSRPPEDMRVSKAGGVRDEDYLASAKIIKEEEKMRDDYHQEVELIIMET